ncbi:hypothetical protein ACNRBV_25540 [Ralstonia pseudosolanacearum]|uniref:hypothetical protein n=1 Tax=Ralstonia pseudosolanacearum TaxID=1310165 RepID=UPI000A45F29A|nr:hypothetical protein [Ralstonia pseudosolanacearum]BCM15385.1 hypothetical protein MAFF241648_45750 [Ralstonia solanacearum]
MGPIPGADAWRNSGRHFPCDQGDWKPLRRRPSAPLSRQRVAVLMPVARLSALLRTTPRQGWTVEHVYDY